MATDWPLLAIHLLVLANCWPVVVDCWLATLRGRPRTGHWCANCCCAFTTGCTPVRIPSLHHTGTADGCFVPARGAREKGDVSVLGLVGVTNALPCHVSQQVLRSHSKHGGARESGDTRKARRAIGAHSLHCWNDAVGRGSVWIWRDGACPPADAHIWGYLVSGGLAATSNQSSVNRVNINSHLCLLDTGAVMCVWGLQTAPQEARGVRVQCHGPYCADD